MASEIHKPWMEPGGATTWRGEHGRLLIVHQHCCGAALKPLTAADEPLLGMRGILAVRTPEMKPPREPQRVDDEMDRRLRARHSNALLAPIALQLPPRRGLTSHGRPPDAQRPLRPEVVPENRELAPLPLGLQLSEDHDGVPHVLC